MSENKYRTFYVTFDPSMNQHYAASIFTAEDLRSRLWDLFPEVAASSIHVIEVTEEAKP